MGHCKLKSLINGRQMLVFEERGKPEYSVKNLLGAEQRTNKDNLMTLSVGIEPG